MAAECWQTILTPGKGRKVPGRETERQRRVKRGEVVSCGITEGSGGGSKWSGEKKIRVGGVKRWRRERENSIIDVKGRKQKTGGGNKVRRQVI